MNLDRVTPHLCEGQQQQKTPTELSLMKVASFGRIAEAISKNNNSDAIYYLAESLSQSIRDLASAMRGESRKQEIPA